MLKPKKNGNSQTPTTPAEDGQFRDNPKVNAAIDEYIKNEPKHWSYIQKMPRERLERTLVLGELQKRDRQERMKAGVMRKLEQNPELKQALDTLGKHLPEGQVLSIASQTMRRLNPRPQQAAGVSV